MDRLKIDQIRILYIASIVLHKRRFPQTFFQNLLFFLILYTHLMQKRTQMSYIGKLREQDEREQSAILLS